VDPEKRRISLGLKQCIQNPWEAFKATHPAGTEVEGEIKNITEFGLFIGLTGEIDGMVHLSDLDWDLPGEEAVKNYGRGDVVKAKVLDVDVDKERISLGIKQLAEDPMRKAASGLQKGQLVKATVVAVQDAGLEVEVDGVTGFIRKGDLARERGDQRAERFNVGDVVDAKVVALDAKTRKFNLSIKAHEIAEEKEAMAEFGSADSGATLGDLLGEKLRKKMSGE
jgi:small subunit ribosomal protein S1